ncbi:UNVERIFIED_CONTAM: hypothetical protein HDU68_004456 [Siphonaria sp. JEL0065]|nr:hypothetical protein HDU68_004456 [Siphonaria sp. JEL0065]
MANSATETSVVIKADFWEAAWVNNRTGWDLGGATPALLSILKSHEQVLFPTADATVLIPGVGRGYDVIAFAAKQGVKVVGLDISATGVAEAQKELTKANLVEDRAQVLVADFFEYKAPPYSVVFDHTFLCAIDPSLRQAWASKMAELVAEGGHLICYMFPIRELDDAGPPYALSVELYESLLTPAFERVFQRDLDLNEMPVSGMDRDKHGKQMISLWKRV